MATKDKTFNFISSSNNMFACVIFIDDSRTNEMFVASGQIVEFNMKMSVFSAQFFAQFKVWSCNLCISSDKISVYMQFLHGKMCVIFVSTAGLNINTEYKMLRAKNTNYLSLFGSFDYTRILFGLNSHFYYVNRIMFTIYTPE